MRISYFVFSISLAIFLSLLTLITTLLSPVIDLRLIYVFFYFSFLNFFLLLLLAFFANSNIRFFGHTLRKSFFVSLSFIYALGYIISSISYLTTLQTTREQTLLFLFKINPLGMTIFYIIITLVFSFFIILFLYRIFDFKIVEKTKSIKILIILSLVLLLFLSYFVYSWIGLYNPILKSYNRGDIIFIKPENVHGNFLINETINSKPNVLFILVDSVSSERVSSYGYVRNVSPNIDSLTRNGVLFKNAYSTATHSDYAQPGLLSSKYMLVNNVRNFFNRDNPRSFIWDVFKMNNYSTAYISSQDDNWADMYKYFNFSSLDYYSYSLTDDSYDYGGGLAKKDYDHKTIDKTLSWLDDYLVNNLDSYSIVNNNGNLSVEKIASRDPFFLYVNLQATHEPLAFPNQYLVNWNDTLDHSEDSERADSALHYVDLQVGRILDYLNKHNLSDNTLIVFSADHGHDWYSRHYIYGHGKSVYDEELKVPLIIYFPKFNEEVIDSKVSQINLVPTLANIINLSYEEDYFFGKPMQDGERFFFYAQNHKYLIGMVHGNIKVIADLNRNLVEVYNLEEDPFEKHNLVYSKKYDYFILELLMWHYCQLNYFSANSQNSNLAEYCDPFL